MKKSCKLKLNKNGFTLVEMLCTIVLIILLTLVMTLLINYGTRSFVTTVRYSEAKELTATINTILSDELRYAKDICPDRYDDPMQMTLKSQLGSLSYTSDNVGELCSITSLNGAIYIVKYVPGDSGSFELDWSNNILGQTAYTKKVTIEDVKVTYDTGTSMFHVSYNVLDPAGKRVFGEPEDTNTVDLDVKPLQPNIVDRNDF